MTPVHPDCGSVEEPDGIEEHQNGPQITMIIITNPETQIPDEYKNAGFWAFDPKHAKAALEYEVIVSVRKGINCCE